MTTSEFKRIICLAYCERRLTGGERCKTCTMNPELTNNFDFGKAAAALIEAGVQTDGTELLSRFSEEVLAEMELLFRQK